MEQRLNWKDLVTQAVRIRKQEKLTQRQLAALAGVTQPTIVKFEKGSTTMRIESALSILAALGLAKRQ